MPLNIAISGAAGRMGQALVGAIAGKPAFRLVGGAERAGSPAIGSELAPGVAITADARTAAATADVWIDFTSPAATVQALGALPANVRAAVIGTTGLSPADEDAIAAAAQRLAIVRSGNFSLGVNLIAALTEQTAQRLGPDWDIEIIETHHRHKADAPSGTALLLGEAAAQGRNVRLESARLAPRDGVSDPRPEGGIGFAVIRGGGIVGEHEVVFAGAREVVRLQHQALDRGVFADGALVAAQWAAAQKPGLYSMRDVLGL